MSSKPPVYTYLSPDGQEEVVGEEPEKIQTAFSEVADMILTVLTWVVLAIVLGVWAVVGAIFWIPLMVRAMFRFSLSLIEATLEGRKPTAAARMLKEAVSFYRRGFVVAIEVVTGEDVGGRDEAPLGDNRLFSEFLWALLVWYFISLLFGWIQASPLDLWDWLTSIPWAEHFGDLLQRFRA